MRSRPAATALGPLAALLAAGCAPAPLRLDLRRNGTPWTPPATTAACPTETAIPWLWIEPPLEQASWVFHAVMPPLDSFGRAHEGLGGPVGDPLLPSGLVLDATIRHDPCLGSPTLPPRLTLRLRDAAQVFDTLSVPVPLSSVPGLLDDAQAHASPPRTWTDDERLHVELRKFGRTEALAWLQRIWCDAGCGGWKMQPCRKRIGYGSDACRLLAYRRPQALWLPGEEHVLELELQLPLGKKSTPSLPPTRFLLDLGAHTLRSEAP